jgi:hypothetical protein
VQVVGYDEKVDQKAELTEINSDERVFALGMNSLPILQNPGSGRILFLLFSEVFPTRIRSNQIRIRLAFSNTQQQ